MKQIQRIRVLLYIAAFIGLAVIIYIWRCALSAYIWAGWGGFGGISLEYTAEGERVGQLLLFGPALFLLFLIVLRVVRNSRGSKGAIKKDAAYCTKIPLCPVS